MKTTTIVAHLFTARWMVVPLSLGMCALQACGGELGDGTDTGSESAALSGPISISSPANGATVPTAVHVVASATAGVPIKLMQVYDNGKKIGEYSGSTVDATFTLAAGAHKLTVQDLNASNAVLAKSSVAITVSAGAPPPVRYSYRCYLSFGTGSQRELNGIEVNSDGTDFTEANVFTGTRIASNEYRVVYDPYDASTYTINPALLLNGISSAVTQTYTGHGQNLWCVVE